MSKKKFPKLVGRSENLGVSSGKTRAEMEDQFKEFFSDAPEEYVEFAKDVMLQAVNAAGGDIQEFNVGENAFNLRVGSANIDFIMNSVIPRTKIGQVQRSYKYYEEDDLLGSLINTKIEASLSGFDLAVTLNEADPILTFEEGETEFIEVQLPNGISTRISRNELEKLKSIAESQNLINQYMISNKLRAATRDMFRDWYVADSFVLYWKIGDTPDQEIIQGEQERFANIEQISVLFPGDVEWDNSFGNDILMYRMPEVIVAKMAAALQAAQGFGKNERDAIQALRKEGIPLSWIEAHLAGQEFVELKNEDGHYWIIKTKNRQLHGIAHPSMTSIFFPLESRKLNSDGEFAASFMMKHFIFHVTMGESIDSGPMSGSRQNWAKKNHIESMFQQIQEVTKSSRMVTNHTVKFDFVFPPPEMFDKAKYEKAEDRIHGWTGVGRTLAFGEEGTNATGFVGLKRLQSNVSDARSEINEAWTEFFQHPTVRPGADVPDGSLVKAVFDQTTLKDPNVILDENKFLMSHNLGDPRTVMRELGRSPDAIRAGRLNFILDAARTGSTVAFTAEPNNLSIGKENTGKAKDEGKTDSSETGGRPANSETETGEETRKQNVSAGA